MSFSPSSPSQSEGEDQQLEALSTGRRNRLQELLEKRSARKPSARHDADLVALGFDGRAVQLGGGDQELCALTELLGSESDERGTVGKTPSRSSTTSQLPKFAKSPTVALVILSSSSDEEPAKHDERELAHISTDSEPESEEHRKHQEKAKLMLVLLSSEDEDTATHQALADIDFEVKREGLLSDPPSTNNFKRLRRKSEIMEHFHCASGSDSGDGEQSIPKRQRLKSMAMESDSGDSELSSTKRQRLMSLSTRRGSSSKRRMVERYASTSNEDSSSVDSVTGEEGSPVDVSFYRQLNQDLFCRREPVEQSVKQQLKAYSRLTAQHERDGSFVPLDVFMTSLAESGECPSVCAFVHRLKRSFTSLESHNDTGNAAEDTARALPPIYLEVIFLKAFFFLAEQESWALTDASKAMELYDSFRVQELFFQLLRLVDTQKPSPPPVIRGFFDKVYNVLSKGLGSGSARQGTPIEFDLQQQNDILHHLLYQQISIKRASGSICSKASEIADMYAEERVRLSYGVTATEKERAKAIRVVMNEVGDDIALMMCSVCQSFPRYCTHQLRLEHFGAKANQDKVFPTEDFDDSDGPTPRTSDVEENYEPMYCTQDCAALLKAISRVSKVWLTMAHLSPALSQIPAEVHKLSRGQPELTNFEALKVIVFMLYTSLEEAVKFTNTCKHAQMANRRT